jgi:hypothetical protein
MSLVNEAKNLMKQGMYDPNALFKILYARHPVHYSKIREAIHTAKVV